MSEGEKLPKSIATQSPETFLEELEKEDTVLKKLQSEAKEIYSKKGELCDSEGFYQHSGECWSDAIQQVMNNSDTLKENVQKKFIDTDFGVNYELPDTVFKIRHDFSFTLPGEIDYSIDVEQKVPESSYLAEIQTQQKTIRALQKKWAILYLKEAQKRFLRHYILESKRRNLTEEQCKMHEPAVLAKWHIRELSKQFEYRSQGKEGRLAAIFGMLKRKGPGSRATLEEYIANKDTLAGAGDRDIETLLSVYNYVFFDKKLEYSYLTMSQLEGSFKFITDDKTFDEYIRTVCGIPFAINIKSRDGGTSGHEMAFYVCGGKEFFYEDNRGIIPFEWRLFFKKYYEMVKQKAAEEKTKQEFEKLQKEKQEAEKDPEKKTAFESLKGKYLEQIQEEYAKLSPETTLKSLSLNCLQYKRGSLKTPYYPCIFYKQKGSFVALTVVAGKLEEVSFGAPKEIQDGEDTIELQFPDTKQGIAFFDTFFMLYGLGTKQEDIKNTGFALNPGARLERTSLLMDIIDKNEDEAVLLIEKDPYIIHSDLDDALFLAIHLNEEKVVQKLIDKDVKVFKQTEEGYSPITLAIQENKPELVKLFLTQQKDSLKSRYKEFTVPYFAFTGDIAYKSTRLTELLLENGFDINSEFQINYYPYKYTLLYLSYLFKSIEMMKFLCSKGATSMNIPKELQTNTVKTLKDLAKSESASQDILDVLEACGAPAGGRFKQTRKRKIEKHRRGSRKHRA